MRCRIILIGLLLSSHSAMAEPTRDAVMAGAARCAGIADNRTWLDCFYGSAQPMRAVLGLPPAPPGQVQLVPPPGAAYVGSGASQANAVPRERSGGFFSDLVGSLKPVATDMPMTSYRFDRDGMFTVTLRNGQVYRQKESDLVRANWTRPASTYLVTVTNSGDGYTLKIKGEPGIIFHARRM